MGSRRVQTPANREKRLGPLAQKRILVAHASGSLSPHIWLIPYEEATKHNQRVRLLDWRHPESKALTFPTRKGERIIYPFFALPSSGAVGLGLYNVAFGLSWYMYLHPAPAQTYVGCGLTEG